MLLSAGLSPNPTNLSGDSLLHMVCRQGDHKLLQTMIDCGTELRVCDDCGRTPLHDVCRSSRSPVFAAVDLIMRLTPGGGHHLFNMIDHRGSTPLAYIRKEHWAQWMKFLQSRKDVYWPVDFKNKNKPPSLTSEKPFSRHLKDPENALPLKLASRVVSGTMLPYQAVLLKHSGLNGAQSLDDSDDDSSFSIWSESGDDENFQRIDE